MKKRCTAILMMVTLMVLALFACEGFAEPMTPLSGSNETPQPVYAAAQSTLEYGQSQMKELSHQATMVNMNMDQAANAAEQTTLDNNQRQLMELSIQETEVSLNMAQAAATQKFIIEQTQMVWNATAAVQSSNATAAYSANIRNITQTAQAQAMLYAQATHTAHANATLTAYSLTATPWAAIQADIVRTRDESNRRAWWGEFVVTPLKVILITLVVLLFIVGAVMAYRRLIPVLELRLRTIWRDNDSPLLLVDGTIVEHDAPHRKSTRWVLNQPELSQFPNYEMPQVEIIDPSDPSVALWITETEQKLRNDGRIQL